MVLVGRIIKNAVISKLKDEREVVNYSIAINDWHKTKNSEKGVKLTTFVNCSYWISPKIAERLTKGALVEITGRIYVNAYTSLDGAAKASLNCQVNSYKVHGSSKQDAVSESTTTSMKKQEEIFDDLPF
jgi:single-strand DNA-binding protein